MRTSIFKVGDEVFVKGKITGTQSGSKYKFDVRLCEAKHLFYSEKEMIPVSKNYEQGLADAWELAKKIGAEIDCGGLSNYEVFTMFGTHCTSEVFGKLTYEEALAKIEAYEKEKEIKVGDEVRCGNVYGVVTYSKNGYASVMWKDGSIGDECECKDLTKTGKHIDIESLLRQIGE
jgi:hypothetical protein